MKRKLLLSLIAVLSFGFANAQIVSIVGTGVNGWPPTNGPEIDLITTDNVTYTLQNQVVTTGVVKFRLNHDWATSWGGSAFPSGTATENGSNIPTTAGTYDITFNIQTLQYSFVGSPMFFEIGIYGPAVDPVNGYDGDDVNMSTSDGVHYTLSAFEFETGPAKFIQDNDETITWGDVDFPTGIAYPDGPAMVVEGGLYTVHFNRQTGEYSFLFPSVGLIGSAINGWDPEPDVDMQTTDGNIYTLMGQMINAGDFKFRQDDSWDVSWGGTGFPSGTFAGNDITVTADQAGYYNITFNRAEGTYSFTPSLSVNSSELNKLKVYPNPSNNVWNIDSASMINNLQVIDVTGKVVLSMKPMSNSASIDASGLDSGIYFAKISNATASQTIKLIRK